MKNSSAWRRRPNNRELAIVSRFARVTAETYELLVLIRQFDERAGWLKWGLSNCAEWLHFRCDLSMSAAREKVRVAHALKTLPNTAASLATGDLAYSQVRAITRVAGAHNEEALLSFALKTTTARVEERCRELRCGTADSLAGAQRAFADRSLRVLRDTERGVMTITLELPMETGELVEKALDKARSRSRCWQRSRAGRTPTSLPIESVKRLCCDGDAVVIVEDEQGEPLSIGRKTRTVPTAIKRALQSRDKSCVFPGCHHKRFVDAHHIQHWSAGGETSLNNLMLLCSQHHKLIHEGGFTIQRDYQNNWFFKRSDGRAVPACGYHLEDMIDDDINDDMEDVSRRAGPRSDVYNNPSAEGILSKVNTFVSDLGPA